MSKPNIKQTFSCLLLLFLAAFLSVCAAKPSVFEPGTFSNLLSPEAQAIVRKGIGAHDEGDYRGALELYSQAMQLAPDHPVIYYEMAFSYLSMGQLETALDNANKGFDRAVQRNYQDVIPALLDMRGSVLYNLGRNEDAIAVYLEAINRYNAASPLVYYNLAINYYRLEQRNNASDALRTGLLLNPNHAGSNYLLGRIYMENGEKTRAFYPFCYFLLLEPITDRGAQAYNTIKHMLSAREEDAEVPLDTETPFAVSDMIIADAYTLDEDNSFADDTEKTRIKLDYVFTTLEEQKKTGAISRSPGDELWWDFYAPFFYRITASEYQDTFYRYIALGVDPDAESWIENSRQEIERFFDWLNDY